MNKHNVNGIHVVEFGENNPQSIIFIHAFPLCNRMWDKQAEALQSKYRVIAYDLRGFGYSESGDGQYIIDTHVDDLMAIISALKLEKPVVCGLSMGGYVTLRALELGQNRFRAAILSDTKSEADNNFNKLNRFKQIKQIKSGDLNGYLDTFLKSGVTEKTFTENPKLVEFIRTMMSWQKASGVVSGLITLASRTDTTDFLERIEIPVLVIVGSDDRYTPPEYSKLIYGKIRDAELAVIPNSGHFPNMENPDEFNKAVLKFLSGVIKEKKEQINKQ